MLFNIHEIEASLKEFHIGFNEINDNLAMRRENFTETMMENILEAYNFLNSLLKKDMDLFTPAGLHSLLEMNHLVLCGTGKEERIHYYEHLVETRKNFHTRINPIREWVLANRNVDKPYKLATGYYTRQLSRPQTFLEGNHRTGNIILNYLLVSKGVAPFIISKDTAKPYLDLSGDIKFTHNDSTIETAFMMPGHAKKFREFLRNNVNEKFIIRSKK